MLVHRRARRQGLGEALMRADESWLSRLVTRREPPARFEEALARQPDDIKVIIQFADA